MQSLTFSLFSDFHYKKGMYPTAVAHLEEILARADRAGAEFVIHCGDFCNDYAGSPELLRAWRGNPQGLAVYGVPANHDLEGAGNSMESIRPNLASRPVTWGGAGYYFFDHGAFRIIGLDSNYSLDESTDMWEHNADGSCGPRKTNARKFSLGPDQLAWLERTLDNAAKKGMHCLLFSHASACPAWRHWSDANTLQILFARINARRAGTVFAMFTGHYHTHHAAVDSGVLHFDVNAAIVGAWKNSREQHYAPEHTYLFTDYDSEGNPLSVSPRSLTELSQATYSWFYTHPLSAIVTIREDGHIKVCGASAQWMYNIVPEVDYDGCMPCIKDFEINLFQTTGA